MTVSTGPSKKGGREKFTLLFVDDEQEILNSLARLFRNENYHILTADSAAKAWQTLKDTKVNVLVTDHRMPGTSGLDLLKKTKTVYPDIIRIMLTGYADIDSVMDAVNQGAVYKFITKPWNDEEIKLTIRLALAQYKLLTENKKLKHAQDQQVKNIDKLSKFINQSQLGEVLVKKRLISQADLKKARVTQVKTGQTMPGILIRMGGVSEKEILGVIQKEFKIKTIDLTAVSIPISLISVLPKEICKSNMVIPVEKNKNQLTVAMADPTDMMKRDALKFMTGFNILALAAPPKEISHKINEIYEAPDFPLPPAEELSFIESQDSIFVQIEEKDANPDLEKFFSTPEPPTVVQVVNAVIAGALNQDASDVHIEPKNQYVAVRHRINGLLSEKMRIPISMHQAVVSRVKVIAQLDISERRRPQDGRITVKTPKQIVDIRLSTLPTIAGEKIVFRILDRNSSIKDIGELGLSDAQVDLVTQLIQHPQGCILVTGPTGSGKTSTLYSLIQKTATIQKNYTTIEDPVEYYMEKAQQVMIKENIGLTFPLVLRTLLRQDPDTIMLGEIRDFETAEVAFHAALTGHTVLSTLHTNSCVATITRLRDMGILSHILSSALNGIIAQRLVRKICPHCMIDDAPSSHTLNRLGIDQGIVTAKKGKGCSQCGHTGYAGRTGIYEVFNVNNEMEMLLQQQATETDIKKFAVANGMHTLIDSGIEKISMGITTCEEIIRVLGPQNLYQFTCPACGKTMAERYNFCPYCAVVLRITCPCGRELDKKWKACPDCGKRRSQRKSPGG